MQVQGLNNTLDEIILTSKDIENQICTYGLTFSKTRRNDVEWKMRFPMFVPSFYNYVINNTSIPSQAEFWQAYLSDNSIYFYDSKLTNDQLEGLKARVYRTYPSLVRDLHFGMSLKSNNSFNDVFYNETIDIEYGVDLVLRKDNVLIGLNLYTNTQIAIHARKVKEYRPKKHLNFKCIELPIEFRGSKSCGDFFLYSDREINQIAEEVLKNV